MSLQQRTVSGRVIFLCFLGFFGTILAVNGIFIYTAIHTNTGVVTENAYEKGLAYNKVLDAAKEQPQLKDKMVYQGDVVQWTIADANGIPLRNGNASVFFMRPVKDGYDFTLALKEKSPGIYEARTDFPVHGLWTAKLDLKWNNQHYQTSQNFIAP